MQEELTQLLVGVAQGDCDSANALLPRIYEELHAMAEQKMRNERAGHTLQPTAVVNEVYLRLIDQTQVEWRDRTHFFAAASNLMRRILIDHARKRSAGKRGGNVKRVQLDEQAISAATDPFELLALDELLTKLQSLNERHARVVELRVFGGMNVSETAEVLGVSPATVKSDYRVARAWLASQCGEDSE